MKKVFKTLLLALLTMSQVIAAPVGQGAKLIDFLVSDSGVLQILGRQGMQGAPANSVQNYVKNALVAFSPASESLTKGELRQIVRDLNVSGEDLKIKDELEGLLEKSADELSEDEVVTAINHLIYLANRHGIRDSVVLACSECVSEALSRKGFRFTFASVSNKNAAEVLNTIIPRKPRELSNFIDQRMKKLDLGSYRHVPKEIVGAEEERSLALFLALADSGSQVQKDFINAVLEVSKRPDGQVNLLDRQNPHKLWKLFEKDMSDSDMQNFTRLLREVAQEGKSDISKKEAFYSVLAREAGDDPVMIEYTNRLKAQNCFFR